MFYFLMPLQLLYETENNTKTYHLLFYSVLGKYC